MTPTRGNLADSPPPAGMAGERFTTLAESGGARVERLDSPADDRPGAWYDQDHDEWVLVAAGDATVEMAAPAAPSMTIRLTAGDWLLLPAHRHHRVAKVAKPTQWIAVHFAP